MPGGETGHIRTTQLTICYYSLFLPSIRHPLDYKGGSLSNKRSNLCLLLGASTTRSGTCSWTIHFSETDVVFKHTT
ncbi:hypothetical protein XA68_11465 [Ophiocordyceps unilateralis]|uniref:Uncharacterized protein n=1 Tax=Ophiocordyceps unilateralis TaxID=268505 RepID=A0A2A9PGV1_OPHUN|nr:hypothetical protein XA68_11465 [Ophiocordyceps unilateralis]